MNLIYIEDRGLEVVWKRYPRAYDSYISIITIDILDGFTSLAYGSVLSDINSKEWKDISFYV